MKDLLAYLFGGSQVENEVEETKSAIEQIMEEAEGQEPLKIERKPLQTALASLDITGDIDYDPEGFSLTCDDEADYRRYTEILLSPDAMEKLAKLGWVVTRCGDVAMANEPAEFRIRFLEITTAGEDGEGDSWPAPNPKLVTKVVKAGRKFMSEPGPHDDDGPIEHDDKTSDDNQKGVGKAQDGEDPEGKPKGSTKSEGLSLAGQLIGEGRHKDGCQCGFCKNMGSFGKKKKEGPDTEEKAKGTEDDSEPPRYDGVSEAKKKITGIGKPKAGKTVPKAFKQ